MRACAAGTKAHSLSSPVATADNAAACFGGGDGHEVISPNPKMDGLGGAKKKATVWDYRGHGIWGGVQIVLSMNAGNAGVPVEMARRQCNRQRCTREVGVGGETDAAPQEFCSSTQNKGEEKCGKGGLRGGPAPTNGTNSSSY